MKSGSTPNVLLPPELLSLPSSSQQSGSCPHLSEGIVIPNRFVGEESAFAPMLDTAALSQTAAIQTKPRRIG
jgi:hypothetical protein